ncbi:MAG: cation:proton antiporter [Bradyrhizobiaceae bacterium]|nr:cation:proton antiporter [Bradyrhizobiaceae bacterium]
MPLVSSLLLLIIAARVFGRLMMRFKQPAIVGEMLAGVLLGPSILGLVHASPALSGISELAVFLIVLSAGLEMQFSDIVESFKSKGIIIGLLGFILPLAAGIVTGWMFGLDANRMVFLGLCIAITALPVAIGILQSFGLLNSQIAKYSISTAVLNDVLALMIMGVILGLPEQRSLDMVAISVFHTLWKLVLLGAMIVGFNWLLEKLVDWGVHVERFPEYLVKWFGQDALFGVVVVFVLAFGTASEQLGFHFVIGAFFGALLIDRKYFLSERYHGLDSTLKSVSDGFLAPIFFVFLGLEFNAGQIPSVWFAVVVVLVSIVTKIFSGWLGGRLINLSQTNSLGIGIILNGRGVMELVIASIAYERGLIGQGLFSTLVLMGVVTTMITPLLFRKFVSPHLTDEQLTTT